MKDAKRSIFRVDALRHYARGKEQPPLPRFGSARTFLCLWILLGLLLAGVLGAWLVQVPVYASGLAVVIDRGDELHQDEDDVAVAAFFPPENLLDLQVGQTLALQISPSGGRLIRQIISVEPEVISPKAAQSKFQIAGGSTSAITQPVAVAIASLEPLPHDLPASTHIGSVYQADVEVRSRRIISFVPLIGRLFGDQR